jgi:hypothetical protein
MDHINYFVNDNLKEGDIFITDLYAQNLSSVYLVLEKELDEVFKVIYLTLLTDKGQIRLVNSNYLNITSGIKKIND